MKNKSVNYFNPGQVYFAGVGPGDVELLTCKARKLIDTADVILYAGSLINPEVLTFTSKDAVCHETSKMLLADQIQIMISAAREGKIIARCIAGIVNLWCNKRTACRVATSWYYLSYYPGVSSLLLLQQH
jgi:precorrin-4 methylase